MVYYLTKSQYLKGLQCHKRLWYEKNPPGKAIDPSRSQQRFLIKVERWGDSLKIIFQRAN